MRKIGLSFTLTALALGFFSCETEIDVNSDEGEIPVVIAAIDPSDSTHYVKITRTFLQDNVNAFDLAADQANFNYAEDELDVVVEEVNSSGNVVNTYPLTRTENEIIKDPGIFDNSVNVLYRFTEGAINQQNTYRLTIIDNTLNREITAETEIVKDINVISPNNRTKVAFFTGLPATGLFLDRIFEIRTGEDVGRVAATLIFNYSDHFSAASGLSPVSRNLRMPLGETATTTNAGNEQITFSIAGERFFTNIENSVDPISGNLSHRELERISIEFVVAGTELNTFIQVSEPSDNINQETPAYTNIDGGLGVFSSRTEVLFTSTAGLGTSQDINLTPDTMRKLSSLGLGFCFGNGEFSGFDCP